MSEHNGIGGLILEGGLYIFDLKKDHPNHGYFFEISIQYGRFSINSIEASLFH